MVPEKVVSPLTVTSNGSVNCMHDSLNPSAGLTPLSGMWRNCIFGGVGVGLINMLVYLIVAVFLAGLDGERAGLGMRSQNGIGANGRKHGNSLANGAGFGERGASAP